jgi:arylsulfatase A-like enzyme
MPGPRPSVPPSARHRRPGGLALALVAALPIALLVAACSGPSALEKCADCNVLLVSIDTLRASRLGCYGGPRPTSPGIDALAAESTLFANAAACSIHTADSHASIFTSTLPSVHEVTNAGSRTGFPLAPGIRTLAEVLSAAGFATAGFHGGGNVSEIYGFGRGFDRYQMTERLDDASDWVAGLEKRPFFLFAHTFHVHDPYTPTRASLAALGIEPRADVEIDLDRLGGAAGAASFREVRDRFWASIDQQDPEQAAYALALYDAEILEVDRMVSRLVREVLRIAPRTIVILTSDHGEEFGEHGRFLHESFYQEVLHVPLVIRYPGRPGRRVTERVSLLDLAPTVLDELGVPAPATFQGRSLGPALAGRANFPRLQVAERMSVEPAGEGLRPVAKRIAAAAYFGDEKAILQTADAAIELYDLAADPREERDLAPLDAVRRAAADAALRRLLAGSDRFSAAIPRGPEREAVTLSPELEEQLRALGYLN